MGDFNTAFAQLIGHEGGYVNNPNDSGGETNWGVTIAKAREAGYTGPMKAMTIDQAKAIYRRLFWDKLKLDQICALSYPIALELFDTGVNLGIGRSVQFLQRALNVLNRLGKDYPDLTVDGLIGPATIQALEKYINLRKADGVSVMVKMLNALQGEFYITLAEKREKDEEFINGWFCTRISIPE